MGNLVSPFPFAERILLYGGGGAGKTNTVLNIASHLSAGHMHVIDADYSMAYDRAMATDFPDVPVTVWDADPEWESFTDTLAKAAAEGDPAHDWLVIDPISPSWDWVQGWYLETAYGHDLARHLVDLKAAHVDDAKAYQAALMDDMNWGVVKKEYEQRVWRVIQRWKGNLILCAEAKELHFREASDSEMQMLYGPIGYKPVGEGRIKHIAASTLFLDHPKRNTWRVTTVKDRNRGEVDKLVVEDFGLDYLVDVAGWEIARRGKS